MDADFTHHLGDLFTSSRKKGRDGLPHYSVTLNDGLVLRGSLERRTDTNIRDTDHLLIEKGYIAYNMMRIWQGALGRASTDGIVSPAYIVLKPTKYVDSLYAAYLFKTRRMIYFFWAYSYGLTSDRLRLYYKDFSKIKVSIPDLPEQRKIAKILQTWDRAIATTEKLIAASKQQKKALMQQLLTGKKRFGGFEGEWSRVELNELLNYTQPTAFIVQSTKYDDSYKIPVLTAGKTFILGYANEEDGIYADNLPAIIFDDFTTASHYVDFPFKVKSSAMKILTSKSDYPLRFVYEAMQRMDFSVGGHQRHWISIFSRLVIRVPDKSEAEQISKFLKTADIEINNLRKKLDALKKEKKALMQQLLTGKRRVKVDE